MQIVFHNNGNAFKFADNWCTSAQTSMLHYSSDFSLFDIVDIQLIQESKTIRKSIEKKVLFFSRTYDVEQEVTNNYIVLSYQKSYLHDCKQSIKISLLPEEESDAKTVIDHLKQRLALKAAHDAQVKAAEELRLSKLYEMEQLRLSNCIYDVVVIDFETTGIKNPMEYERYDEILSVSIIDQDGHVLLDSLCKPVKRKTWTQAQEIHGISPSMVKDKPTFESLFPEIKRILYQSKVVIAYNISFEMSFLWGYDIKFGHPNGTQLIKHVVWGPDPMLMYCEYKGLERWQKLTTVAKHFKYTFNAHSSLEDVYATLHCYKKLLQASQLPENACILRSGFGYENGIRGEWLDYSTYTISPGVSVDYPSAYQQK